MRTKQNLALQLVVSLVASICGVSFVWALREDYMQRSTANLYVPFLYPPLSVIVSFASSCLASKGLIFIFDLFSMMKRRQEIEIEAYQSETSKLLTRSA